MEVIMSEMVKVQIQQREDKFVKKYVSVTIPARFWSIIDDVTHMSASINEDGDLVYSPVR